VADGLAECIEEFLLKHNPGPTLLDRFRRPRRWDGSKFYTNFQVARLDFGRSKEYRALFEHVDEAGGIFTHR
jgi:hypothetical protein